MTTTLNQLMFDANAQKLARGGVGAATTAYDRRGHHAARQSMAQIIIRRTTTPSATEGVTLDGLDVSRLSHQIDQHLQAREEFGAIGRSIESHNDYLQMVREIRADKPTQRSRRLRDLADTTLSAGLVQFRTEVARAVSQCPFQADAYLDEARRLLEQLVIPEPSWQSLQHLEGLLRGRDALMACRARIPESSLNSLRFRLDEFVMAAIAESRNALAAQLAGEALRREWAALLAFLDALRDVARRFRHALGEFRQATETPSEKLVSDDVLSNAAVVVPLDGPTADEIIAGMIERHGCSDRETLADQLRDKLLLKLRQRAQVEAPEVADSGTFGDLLTRLSPSTVLDAYHTVFENSLGTGHRLYPLAEQYGALKLVRELWRRADPFCRLSDRDVSAFHVTPTQHAVVRLPKPTADEEPVYAAIIRGFRDLGTCAVLETSQEDAHAISVVRVNLGWPITIDDTNSVLLQAYAAAAEYGHPLHLVGVLGGTDDGLAHRDYCQLAHECGLTKSVGAMEPSHETE